MHYLRHSPAGQPIRFVLRRTLQNATFVGAFAQAQLKRFLSRASKPAVASASSRWALTRAYCRAETFAKPIHNPAIRSLAHSPRPSITCNRDLCPIPRAISASTLSRVETKESCRPTRRQPDFSCVPYRCELCSVALHFGYLIISRSRPISGCRKSFLSHLLRRFCA